MWRQPVWSEDDVAPRVYEDHASPDHRNKAPRARGP